MPRHIPEALGKYFEIKYYVDYNHEGTMANRRSHSDIIIYVNNELAVAPNGKSTIGILISSVSSDLPS